MGFRSKKATWILVLILLTVVAVIRYIQTQEYHYRFQSLQALHMGESSYILIECVRVSEKFFPFSEPAVRTEISGQFLLSVSQNEVDLAALPVSPSVHPVKARLIVKDDVVYLLRRTNADRKYWILFVLKQGEFRESTASPEEFVARILNETPRTEVDLFKFFNHAKTINGYSFHESTTCNSFLDIALDSQSHLRLKFIEPYWFLLIGSKTNKDSPLLKLNSKTGSVSKSGS